MTVHLVYPNGDPARTPGAIGWHLSRLLGHRYGEVVCHAWDSFQRIRPDRGDMLIGHLHPVPGTTMRRSIPQDGWRRKVLLQPFNFDIAQVGFLDPWIPRVDAFLAICGPEWAQRLDFSYFSHWQSKFVPIDLAVDSAFFPFRQLKKPPTRALLYVGHLRWYKNPKSLEDLAEALPEFTLGWMGQGPGLRGWEALGHQPLSAVQGRSLAHEYPATISLGTFDANPTTVLESMALGLLPFATPTSGWSENQGVVHVPVWDVDSTATIIRDRFNESLESWQTSLRTNRERVEQDFRWDNFAERIISVLEDDTPRSSSRPRDARRRIIFLGSAASPLLRRQILPVSAWDTFKRRVASSRDGSTH